jgi:hypothetical protein
MDSSSAQDALRAVEAASSAARRRSRGGAAIFIGLGVAETLIIWLVGGPLLRSSGGGAAVTLILMLFPLMAATGYSASRPATPRHSRAVNASLLGVATAAASVTLTVGNAVFPESNAWWIAGAVLSGLAIALCGLLEFQSRATQR